MAVFEAVSTISNLVGVHSKISERRESGIEVPDRNNFIATDMSPFTSSATCP